MAIQKGTGFTNLNKILKASQGNKLGQTISGGIEQQVEGVKSQVKSAQEQFQEEAQKNRLDTQESAQKRSEILGRFAPSTGASNVKPQAGATKPPVQAPVSDQEIQDFTKFRTGTYTGPKDIKDSATLLGKAQQTEELGGLARSEGGRQELLRRFVGGTGYTPGQRQLDTSILGQQPGELGAAARQARGTEDLVSGASQQASNLAQEYIGRAKQFGQETTKKIGETKAPLASDLDKRVAEAQKAEQTRTGSLKQIQDLLVGNTEEFKGLDKWTRAGLALQEASDRGVLSQGDINMLLGTGGKTGLLQRGANLGLDMNKLINERITNQIAQNIARTGIASEEDIARLNALDKLAGKQGTDLEFLQGQGKFAAGKTGFNTKSLEEYIAKTEAEKARKDKAYADELAAERARYMNMAQAGLMQSIGGGMDTVGGGLGAVLDPMGNLTGENQAAIIGGVGNMGIGQAQFASQGSNALLEGLTKLNVGGKSIANTEGGRQLLKAIELKSKLEQQGLGAANKGVASVTGGITDLGKGNIGSALGALSGYDLAKDLGSEINKNIQAEAKKALEKAGLGNVGKSVGGAVSNIGKSVGGAIKSIGGGGGIKISDEDLKTDIDYTPQDVQKFMDRIKPAAYNYKEEVKDSPLASENRELGVMAQDLEKSELGKEAVHDTPNGKVVDYDNLEPKMLASIAALNKRLKQLENGEDD
jgi:hypothetical protein